MNINEIRNGIIEERKRVIDLMDSAKRERDDAYAIFEAKERTYARYQKIVSSYNYALNNIDGIDEDEEA